MLWWAFVYDKWWNRLVLILNWLSPVHLLMSGRLPRQGLSCHLLKSLAEDPVQFLEVVRVKGDVLDVVPLVLPHLPSHLPPVFAALVAVLNVEHAPILDVHIVVRQVEVG